MMIQSLMKSVFSVLAQQTHDVATTSHDVATTSVTLPQRCGNVMCLLGGLSHVPIFGQLLEIKSFEVIFSLYFVDDNDAQQN